MAIPPEMSKHLDEWIGTVPSVWWIYLRLRVRGYLSPGASGEAVRRVLRYTIDEWERPRREHDAWRRSKGLTEEQAPHAPGASWNTLVPPRLLEEKLLSAKGEEMARWLPERWR